MKTCYYEKNIMQGYSDYENIIKEYEKKRKEYEKKRIKEEQEKDIEKIRIICQNLKDINNSQSDITEKENKISKLLETIQDLYEIEIDSLTIEFKVYYDEELKIIKDYIKKQQNKPTLVYHFISGHRSSHIRCETSISNILHQGLLSPEELKKQYPEKVTLDDSLLERRRKSIYFAPVDNNPKTEWVAIEVSGESKVYDASHLDRNSSDSTYKEDAITISNFRWHKNRGLKPPKWDSVYAEYIEKNAVPSEKIVAFARIEKTYTNTDYKPNDTEISKIQKFLHHKLQEFTQFNNPRQNIAVSEEGYGITRKINIRISYNKNKINGREQEVQEIFNEFTTMKELLDMANEFVVPEQQKKQPTQAAPSKSIDMAKKSVVPEQQKKQPTQAAPSKSISNFLCINLFSCGKKPRI